MTLCRHFGTCGGCTLQDVPDLAYRALKRELVVAALRRHGLDIPVGELVSVLPRSRRRATFKVAKSKGSVAVGFHAASTHQIVDMHECHVLTPAIATLVPRLRDVMGAVLGEGDTADVSVTETESGFDLLIKSSRTLTPTVVAEMAKWAERSGVARIVWGKEIVVAYAPPLVRLAGVEVMVPPSAFLQPTLQGETALQTCVAEALSAQARIADLFCGCGTFTFALAKRARVHAIDSDKAMLTALGSAAARATGLKQITTAIRNLFRQPLAGQELASYDAVVLNPPRAGALAQVKALTEASIPRIAYVSCDPDSFGRDATFLVRAGYRTRFVMPVDQFLWSAHIELVSLFELPD